MVSQQQAQIQNLEKQISDLRTRSSLQQEQVKYTKRAQQQLREASKRNQMYGLTTQSQADSAESSGI